MTRAAGSAVAAVAVVVVAVGLGVTACADPATETPSARERVDAAVAEKLDGWLARRAKNCRREAMAEALVRADSLVLDYAREQKLTLERPSRPLRPDEPPLRRPSDTLVLGPFLQRADTLGDL